MDSTLVKIGAAAAVMVVGLACADQPGTDPVAGPSFNTIPPNPDVVVVCKDAGAPAGTYSFTVSQEGGRGGNLLSGTDFTLEPGDCTTVWEALPDPPTSDPPVTVTVTEVDIPLGVQFDSALAQMEGQTPVAVTTTDVSVYVNYYHGALITYFNSEVFEPALGRMTGGGGQIIIGDVQVTKGLTLHCDITLSNNLEINWPDNKWHLDKPITSAECIDDPAVDPTPPVAPFDTFIGEAIGRLNGVDGSFIRFIFVDAGEPGGKNDRASIQIWAPGADPSVDPPVLNMPLDFTEHGNLQAHYDQPHGNKP